MKISTQRSRKQVVTLSFWWFLSTTVATSAAFVIPKTPSTPSWLLGQEQQQRMIGSSSLSLSSTASPVVVEEEEERRSLGSQELLMLPRQYGPNRKVTFPQMTHVSVTVLSQTPKEDHLRNAIQTTMLAHPLLHCHIEGDGEPEKRIDLFQMVRKGEPNPCTFVAGSNDAQRISMDDVFKVAPPIAVPRSTDKSDVREALDRSWKSSFERDIDTGTWCNLERGPLWKVEWHRFAGEDDEDDIPQTKPCALVFSFNHAISDQGSANKVADQIINYLAAQEEGKSISPVVQTMPVKLEDSVMGKHQSWADVQTDGISVGTLLYVAGKAAEGFRNPVILPDPSEEQEEEDDTNTLLGALTIISGKAAGGEDAGSEARKTTAQFRTVSEPTTTALLSKCRQNQVAMTNALSAAMTFSAADFIDGGILKEHKKRNYKVLQSLDMRRFGQRIDEGTTVACMAGSMDLMHGPIDDRSGQQLRSNPTPERLQAFWELAQNGKQQTEAFIRSNGPYQAVRVFDFAMTISDLNNLVHLTAQSKDSKGRAYSAGITNVGVYERQVAYEQQGDDEAKFLQTQHGRFRVEDIFFGSSHARSGCLYQLSCVTTGGELKLTFHPAAPIVSEEINRQFADAFVELLETVANN